MSLFVKQVVVEKDELERLYSVEFRCKSALDCAKGTLLAIKETLSSELVGNNSLPSILSRIDSDLYHINQYSQWTSKRVLGLNWFECLLLAFKYTNHLGYISNGGKSWTNRYGMRFATGVCKLKNLVKMPWNRYTKIQ